MYKKTIKYVDYNGNEREEDCYFNLTDAELTDMELGVDGGFSAMLNRIVKAQDVPALIKVFKEMIIKSYGIKSDDGRRFIKSPELAEEFTQTPAYNELYMSLATDEKKAAEFIRAIMPPKTMAKVAEQEKDNKILNIESHK